MILMHYTVFDVVNKEKHTEQNVLSAQNKVKHQSKMCKIGKIAVSHML